MGRRDGERSRGGGGGGVKIIKNGLNGDSANILNNHKPKKVMAYAVDSLTVNNILRLLLVFYCALCAPNVGNCQKYRKLKMFATF